MTFCGEHHQPVHRCKLCRIADLERQLAAAVERAERAEAALATVRLRWQGMRAELCTPCLRMVRDVEWLDEQFTPEEQAAIAAAENGPFEEF